MDLFNFYPPAYATLPLPNFIMPPDLTVSGAVIQAASDNHHQIIHLAPLNSDRTDFMRDGDGQIADWFVWFFDVPSGPQGRDFVRLFPADAIVSFALYPRIDGVRVGSGNVLPVYVCPQGTLPPPGQHCGEVPGSVAIRPPTGDPGRLAPDGPPPERPLPRPAVDPAGVEANLKAVNFTARALEVGFPDLFPDDRWSFAPGAAGRDRAAALIASFPDWIVPDSAGAAGVSCHARGTGDSAAGAELVLLADGTVLARFTEVTPTPALPFATYSLEIVLGPLSHVVPPTGPLPSVAAAGAALISIDWRYRIGPMPYPEAASVTQRLFDAAPGSDRMFGEILHPYSDPYFAALMFSGSPIIIFDVRDGTMDLDPDLSLEGRRVLTYTGFRELAGSRFSPPSTVPMDLLNEMMLTLRYPLHWTGEAVRQIIEAEALIYMRDVFPRLQNCAP